MIKYLKNNIILIIAIIVLIGLGILCILINSDSVYQLFSIFAFIYLIGIGFWMLYSSFKNRKELSENTSFFKSANGYLVQSILFICFGILVLIFPNFLVRLLIGLVLIFQPLMGLINSPKKLNYLKNNFWKFLVGIIFIFAVDIVLDIILAIFGVTLIVFAIYLIYILVTNYRDKTYPNVLTKYLVIYLNKKYK